MSYNEKCNSCKSNGHEYLVGDMCLSCAEKRIEQLEKEKKALTVRCINHCNDMVKLVGSNQGVYDYLFEKGVEYPKNLITGVKSLVEQLEKENKELRESLLNIRQQLPDKRFEGYCKNMRIIIDSALVKKEKD